MNDRVGKAREAKPLEQNVQGARPQCECMLGKGLGGKASAVASRIFTKRGGGGGRPVVYPGCADPSGRLTASVAKPLGEVPGMTSPGLSNSDGGSQVSKPSEEKAVNIKARGCMEDQVWEAKPLEQQAQGLGPRAK
jgi:hypothetical protein